MTAWTYTLPLDRPEWVRNCTRFHGTTLLLVRRSGDQEIRLGEMIYVDHEGDVVHAVDEGVRLS